LSEEQQPDRRSRVFAWIVSHPKTVICASILTFLLLLVLLFDHLAASRLERRIAAIRARGEPTCVEDLAAAMPKIPDEENMALRIEELGEKLEAFPIPEEWNKNLPIIGLARDTPTGRRLPPEQLEATKWYLAKFPEELEAIREALQLERGCANIKFSSPLWNTLSRSFARSRLATRIVALEVLVAAEDDDHDRARRCLVCLCRAKRVFEPEPFLIGSLMQMSSVAIACNQIERTINNCSLGEATLRSLQEEIASPRQAVDLKSAMNQERVLFIDMMLLLRTSSTVAGFSGSLPASTGTNFWRYVPILPAVDTTDGLRVYSKMVEAIDQPDAQSIQRMKTAEAGAAALPTYSVMSRTMIPRLSHVAELWVRGVGLNRALQAALACERYRLSHGEWPADLDALVPEYLEAVPPDPFDGKAIRYKQIPEGICVWAIGEDLIDNGGDVLRLEIPKPPRRASDFGWVLLNPELRGRPADTEEAKPQPAAASAPAEASAIHD
jgi:hypothetical protein